MNAKLEQKARERARHMRHNVCENDHHPGLPKLQVDCAQCVTTALLDFRREELEEATKIALEYPLSVENCMAAVASFQQHKSIGNIVALVSNGIAQAIWRLKEE